MNNQWRFAAASLAAAITAAAGYPLFLFVLVIFGDPADFKKAALMSGIIFVYAFLVAAAHLVVLGIPAVWALKKLNALRLGTIASAGFLIGGIPAAFLDLQIGAWAGLFGLLGALAFWAVWRRSAVSGNS